MKKYDSYKDSGIEWIGEIPSHWDFYNLKFILREGVKDGPHETPIWFEEGIPFLSIDGIVNGEISFEKCRYIDEQQFEQFSKKLIIEKDDIFIGKAASIGKIARVKTDRKFTVWSPIAVIKVKKEFIPTFVEYYFRSDVVQHQIELLSTSNTQKNIAMGDIPKMKFIAPTEEEQTVIANFLDHKTTQIDHLITKKEQFIQLLEEERVAVINQAVTKGLDPSVPMKDSGIEWLGKIPEHWESYRIDWVANIVRGNTGFRKDELLDSGDYVALQYGKTYKVDIVDNSFNFFVNSEFYKESQIVTKGDTILISTSETFEDLGHTCFYINENDGLLGGEQILLKPNRTVLNEKYLYQYVRQFCRELQKYAKGLKVFRFSTHDLKQIFIAIPTIEEQIKIVDFLDIETIRIDSLTSKMEKEIELLKEYKTALISEVVTGKVDVRNEKLN